METLSLRSALYIVVLIVLINSNDVASTDKLFVADGSLGQIFIAETDGDSFLASTFTPLNLTVNDSPIGIDYDYRLDMIYWSDQTNGTIHRSTSDGSFDEVIANDTSVPHGIALDLEENKVFWLSAGNGSLYRSDITGSNLQILPPVYSSPRGITISYNRRKLYITTRGSPAIRSVNTDGTDDAILIDTDIVSPGGIAFDFTEQRLYWTDDILDKVEFVNPDDTSDRTIVISITPGSGLDLFPYGLALHDNDIYFSDITHSIIVYSDSTTGAVDVLTSAFSLPAEIHIFMDVCANRCLNNGRCVRSLTSVKCECPFGFLGQRCEFDVCTGRCVNGGTCVPFERGSICICPDGFSGSKCDSRSKYAPLIFICDEEAGVILEGSADTLEFSPLPIPNGHRPVAVGYSPEEDFIFWVDARNGTLNRAFRNGSDHAVLGNTFSDITDLTIDYNSQILGYIATQTNLILQQGFDVASTSKVIYTGVSDLTSVCYHPNTDLYALDNGLAPAILRITLADNFSSLERIDKSSAMNLSTMTFDRHGSRLFMVDVVKGTLETCDPLGEDQDVLLTYQDTQPVDIEWYRGSPFWTDTGSYKGIGFMAQRGGPSTGVTNLQQFQRGAGVYAYHGIAYERLGGDDCLEDEFPCNDTLCIPISWRCDGLVDCEGEMDEIDCYSEPDSIVFVSDLDTSAIFMATTTNLSFTKLPLTDLQTPTAVDYDPVDSMIYWADSRDGSISSAYLDGTNQQKIVTELGTPDGLFFDVQTKMIYWTDVGLSNLGSMYSNGTGRRELLTNLDKPRAIIIVSINRMIYWTDWGDIPKIELCDLNGENRQVVIGNELGWPNGLSYDRIDSRLFWCDALLDKIESSDLYGNDRKLLLDISHGVLHPFDIIFHHGVVMWTDWNCDCIGVREESPHAWPKTYLLPGGPFTRPGGFHVFEDIDECASGPCQNKGNCMDGINSYTCKCTQGYNGPTCEIDIDECVSGPCLNEGNCMDGINSYTCNCTLGYIGSTCEIDIDECVSGPCQNGGNCMDGINSYTCICAQGYTGSNCEINIDECASSPCLNGWTCLDGMNYYTCNCAPGFTGLSCEIDIDECVSGPCQNGGNCMDGINSYTCICAQGYTGSNCEINIDECASSPCLNGWTCVDGMNYYTCNCPPGFTGLSCEIDIDECASIPCQNGGSCMNGINSYTCICAQGYTGSNCEINIDECASSPCLNGWTCLDGMNYYTCNCAPGFTGLSCEIDIDECVSGPCQNGGNCMDGINSYTCICAQGYTGSNCEINIDECASSPCLNGWTCVDGMNYYTCNCPPGFTGLSCEIDIDECASIPCQNGGSCMNGINSYTCNCTLGYIGSTCEIDISECASGPCLNGGSCMDDINFYTCLCPIGYTGVDCSTEISTTTTNTPTTLSTTPTTVLPELIRVVSSPTSLTVSALERVEMTCGFENAVRFEWQKDNVTIPGTENQPVYTILSMTPSYIGYFRCRGEGRNHNGVTEIFTDQASIYITELSNVLIQNARFNINVTSSGDLSDITSQYYSDASGMIENYVQTGLMEFGNFEENSLSVVSSNLREGSIIANLNMYVVENATSSFEIHQNVEDSFLALSAQSDGILDASTVMITSTSICPTFAWMSRFGETVFVAGEVNSRYNSTGPKCPFNTTNAHQPVATALCFGDKISKPKWIPDNNCGVFKNVSELLKEISSVEVTEDNAEEIVEQVAIVTESTEELTSSDISEISGLVLDTVNQNNSGREFTAFVVSIVNNVGSADTTDLQEAQDSSNAVSNMFEAYETQLNKVNVEEDPFDISEENLAVQVRNVLLEELDQGFGFFLSGESATDLSNANITATMGEDSEEQRVGLIAEVRFPPEIASLVDTNVKVIFNVFANPVLFSSPSLLNSSRENPDVNTTVNTPVVLLSIGDVEVEGLGQSINLTFTALVPDYVNQQCVFWDQENSLWSPDGCQVVPSKSGTSVLSGSSSGAGVNGSNTDIESSILETYTCACDHLTNFAILMDIHGATGVKTAYTYLSFIGCAISTICLVISLGTYLWNKKLRSRQTHQIFICLCATLLGLYITFLTMLALDTAGDTVRVNPGACSFLAGLIHFFVLSSIAWMGVEGFNTYLVIVKIFNTYIPKFMVKAGLAAWGIPAIIVILTGGIANTKYARQEVCFIRLWSQVGGLLIPVAVVLVANVVIFILAIRQLSKSSQMAGKIKKDSDATREETIERIKNAIAILVLLGLTWITGYLLLIETFTLVVQALFILFNSFQGLFIFILYCVRKPLIRQQWGLTCSCFEGDVSYGRRVSAASTSESLTAISKFLTSRRKRKYSTGDEVLTGVSSGTDPLPSPSISNPAYSEGDVAFDGYSGMDYGSYKERPDESNI
ncbi:low-density lipoprotein receptor-related protein 2-like isoform X2 [Lytechinus pictus]|uniref:low-density lipoprotein receptor-related protein 2-like isoform X2 n=1 Tax=Lytechinus pictus TaxID=7653 RepID=UPI0030BA15F2